GKMTRNSSRWVSLSLADLDDIAALHRREVSRARRCGPSNKALAEQKNEVWMDLAWMSNLNNRLFPGGCQIEANALAQFEGAIYPIWKAIEVQDKKLEDSLTLEQVNAPGQVLFECDTLHKQDLAIFNSGIKPNRMTGDQAI